MSMNTGASRFQIVLLAALALGAFPSCAIAQDRVPLREGNIWGGFDHEPVPSEVHRDEEAAGIAKSPAQQDKTTGDVESLYRQLMGNEAGR
jgi:hypothetical protein